MALISCQRTKQEKAILNKKVTEKDIIKINQPSSPEQYTIEKDKLLGVVNGNKIVYDYSKFDYGYGYKGDYLTINAISNQRKKEIHSEQIIYGLNEVSLVYFFNQPFIYISVQDARNNYGNFYSLDRNTFKLTEVRDTIYKGTIKIPNFKDEEWDFRGTQSLEFDGKTISSYMYYRKKDGSLEQSIHEATYKMSRDEKGDFILRCTGIKIAP